MRFLISGLSTLIVAGASACIAANRSTAIPIGPVHTVTAEAGVVPSGTPLVVRTNDTIRTRKAYRSTVYQASVAEDIMDQNGAVLIARDSPVELVVRSIPYLGPGGVGMWILTLTIKSLNVGGVQYPVEAGDEAPGAGGIGVDRGAATWAGGGDAKAGHVVTRGHSINVPTNTLLAFQIQDPIRLRGYRR